MVQGVSSDAGKSLVVTAVCRGCGDKPCALAVSHVGDCAPGQPADAVVRMVRGERLAALTTCYTQVGCLAIDNAAGNVAAVDDLQARPDPNAEYHCQFRRVTNPESIAVAIDNGRFLQGPGAGPDSDPVPRSGATAPGLRGRHCRFTAVDAESSSGWDGRTGPRGWQTWTDPQPYYAGDPSEVLGPRADHPRGSCDLQRSVDAPAAERVDLSAMRLSRGPRHSRGARPLTAWDIHPPNRARI